MFWKKYRVVNRKRFFTFVFITTLVSAFLISSLFRSYKSFGRSVETYAYVLIEEGDTLWDIAKLYTDEDKDIRKSVHNIQVINDKLSKNIYPGEIIKVPNNK